MTLWQAPAALRLPEGASAGGVGGAVRRADVMAKAAFHRPSSDVQTARDTSAPARVVEYVRRSTAHFATVRRPTARTTYAPRKRHGPAPGCAGSAECTDRSHDTTSLSAAPSRAGKRQDTAPRPATAVASTGATTRPRAPRRRKRRQEPGHGHAPRGVGSADKRQDTDTCPAASEAPTGARTRPGAPQRRKRRQGPRLGPAPRNAVTRHKSQHTTPRPATASGTPHRSLQPSSCTSPAPQRHASHQPSQ